LPSGKSATGTWLGIAHCALTRRFAAPSPGGRGTTPRDSPSPTGRRWPEGPDEGALQSLKAIPETQPDRILPEPSAKGRTGFRKSERRPTASGRSRYESTEPAPKVRAAPDL